MKKFDFGAPFTYMFKDPNWVTKFLIGILISLVPILNLAWSGYGIGIMRNMAKGDEHPMPEWDEIGKKFMDGLFVAIAGFVYMIPMWIVMCIAFLPTMFVSDSDTAASLATAGGVIVSCCVLVYVLLFSFLMPAILIHYAREDSFGALFQLREIFALATQNIGQYVMAWLVSLLVVLIFTLLSPILVILCVFPIYFGVAWVMAATHYAYGQVGLILESTPDTM